jgi:hypothetical protein
MQDQTEEEYVTIGDARALLGPSMEFRWLKWKDGGWAYGMTLQQKWTAAVYRRSAECGTEREGVEVWRSVPVVLGDPPADLQPNQK